MGRKLESGLPAFFPRIQANLSSGDVDAMFNISWAFNGPPSVQRPGPKYDIELLSVNNFDGMIAGGTLKKGNELVPVLIPPEGTFLKLKTVINYKSFDTFGILNKAILARAGIKTGDPLSVRQSKYEQYLADYHKMTIAEVRAIEIPTIIDPAYRHLNSPGSS